MTICCFMFGGGLQPELSNISMFIGPVSDEEYEWMQTNHIPKPNGQIYQIDISHRFQANWVLDNQH